MPDTRRELATLQALYPDNTAGDISAQDFRDGVQSVHPDRVVQAGAFASRPSSGRVTGDLYLATDGPYLSRFDGTNWKSWALGQPVVEPADPGTWVNQGSATLATTGGVLCLQCAGGSNAVHARVKSAPATPWKVRALLRFVAAELTPGGGGNEAGGGLCFRQSSDGKLIEVSFRLYDNNSLAPRLHVRKWDTATSFNAQVFAFDSGFGAGPTWVEIGDDGTNRTIKLSPDGVNWSTAVYSEARTTYLTADQYGLQVVPNTMQSNLAVFSLGES
jgi:hypothetical protein